ncbi:unnamed protein product, partial [Hymenolepis diminuta]
MLSKKTQPDRKRENKKSGFAVNISVYARDYRLGRQWTAVTITKRHGGMIYDVEISGYGSVAYRSNKNETFLSLGRSALEDLWVTCLRREILEEMII